MVFSIFADFRIPNSDCLLLRDIFENLTLNISLNKEVILRHFTSTKLNLPHPKCVAKIDSL